MFIYIHVYTHAGCVICMYLHCVCGVFKDDDESADEESPDTATLTSRFKEGCQLL